MKSSQHEIRIGIVGHPCSGKDTVAAYLVDTHQFVHVATGDLVRAYIAEHNLGTTTRDIEKIVATILRIEHGPDHFAQMALQTEATRLAVGGLRTVAEVMALKRAGGVIIACHAPIRDRYQREKERGRNGNLTFEVFEQRELAEAANENPAAQNVAAVIALADYTINNEGSLEHLHRRAGQILAEIQPARAAGPDAA